MSAEPFGRGEPLTPDLAWRTVLQFDRPGKIWIEKKCRVESVVLRAEGPVQPLPGPKAPDANSDPMERPGGPTQDPSPRPKTK